MGIGQLAQDMRVQRDLRRTELAARIGRSEDTIYNLECKDKYTKTTIRLVFDELAQIIPPTLAQTAAFYEAAGLDPRLPPPHVHTRDLEREMRRLRAPEQQVASRRMPEDVYNAARELYLRVGEQAALDVLSAALHCCEMAGSTPPDGDTK